MIRPTIAVFVAITATVPLRVRAEPPTAGPHQPSASSFGPMPPVSSDDGRQRAIGALEVALAEGRFDDARRGYLTAYEEDPDPSYLYAAALAAERAGDCGSAGYAFLKYLETQPPLDRRERAEFGISMCEINLATLRPLPQPKSPPPPAPSQRVVAATSDTPATSDQDLEVWRDPWGGTLALVGGVALGAGLGLLRPSAKTPTTTGSASNIEKEAVRAGHLSRATTAMFVIGIAGLAGAVIRYSLLKRQAQASRLALGPGGTTVRF